MPSLRMLEKIPNYELVEHSGNIVSDEGLSWKGAVLAVLQNHDGSLSPQEIVEQISLQGLRKITGKTPSATVARQLLDLMDSGNPKVKKMGRGLYAHSGLEDSDDQVINDENLVITNFGIGWERNEVLWTRNPKLLGVEVEDSEPIDISNEEGIYILLDGREIMYIGRTTGRPIGVRLSEHARGRMKNRWNRFSWFSILDKSVSQFELISTIESILIEALEPRLNRQGGQNLGIELIQKADPEIERKRKKQFLRDAMDRI